MSRINEAITNEMVIPEVQGLGWLFEGREDSRFAAGVIMLGETALEGFEGAKNAYMMLRGQVYVTQTRMVSEERLVQTGPEAGSEIPDEDDVRSVHFGVFENLGSVIRMVGSQRHIRKTLEDPRPLPIENFFPTAFCEPAKPGSFEVSRYIQRHEDVSLQDSLTFPLLRTAVLYALSHSDEPAYGVVEEGLERKLRDRASVPLRRIAEPMMVPDYAADNLGIVIDLHEMARRYGISQEVIAAAKEREQSFHYFGKTPAPNTTAA